jgi:HSP20 family molecular chaperone IbpA
MQRGVNMKEKIVIDLGKIMDEIFNAAQDFRDAFQDGFQCKDERCWDYVWDEKVDYYPAFSYPPTNVYITKDKSLVFEFALAGFQKSGIDLQFQGDYMILTANIPDEMKPEEDIRYFKRRLKLKDIEGQKYYVPADKFNQGEVKAVYKNGILKVVIPANEDVKAQEGIKIEIVEEEE